MPLAMAGDEMRHASTIARLVDEALGRAGRVAVMKTLPVSDTRGLWVLRLHRVPTGNDLQANAILQKEGRVIKASVTLPKNICCWPASSQAAVFIKHQHQNAYAQRNPTCESASSFRLGPDKSADVACPAGAIVSLRVGLTQGLLHRGCACLERRSKCCLQAPAS